jgi:hypothetical protein
MIKSINPIIEIIVYEACVNNILFKEIKILSTYEIAPFNYY